MKKYIVTVLGLLFAPALALACPVSNPNPLPPNPPPQYVVQINKTLTSPASGLISEGDTVTYVITAVNQGSLPAGTAIAPFAVIDWHPAGWIFVPGSSDPGCKVTGQGNVTCSFVSNILPSNATKTWKLAFTVPAGTCAVGNVVENRASLLNPSPSQNNHALSKSLAIVSSLCVAKPTPTPTPEVKKEVENPGIDITKKVSNTTTRPGHTVKYEITVKNTGKVQLMDVEVTDALANSFRDIKLDGKSLGSNTFHVGNQTLEPGQSVTYHVEGTVKDNVACGSTIKNTATAKSADHGVEDEASAETQVECQQVKAAVVVQPLAVPVTARTGATEMTSLVATLLGAAGLGIARKVR